MRWSWRLMTLSGIGVYVHATFLLLILWAAWSGYAMGQSWWNAIEGVLFILTLFAIVVLHELGHAIAARRFGIATRDITLLPIGGVARLERMPEDPKQELAVALAGPAVNVVLAVLFAAILAMTRQLTWPAGIEWIGGNWLTALLAINIWLAAFNLLPAFPMDGGRVLRALLAIRMDYARATRIAAGVGQGAAVVFGLIGLMMPLPLLILIAVFIWIGASQESSLVQMKTGLVGVHVHQVMITDFRTLAPEDTLDLAVDYLLAGYQQDFPVLSESKVEGLLTRSALVEGLAKLGVNMPVADAMEKEFEIAAPDDTAEAAFLLMQTSGERTVPVLEEDRLVGIVTRENLAEYLMIQTALHAKPGERVRVAAEV